jgi:flagellin
MRINNNIAALNTHRQYGINNNNVASSVEKLSSGYRINRAGDDAAGLAISEKMRAQIRGLNMASKNSQDAISLIQTAEGALQETHNILQRMRELAVQAASDTNDGDYEKGKDGGVDRAALDAEFQELLKEINNIAEQTAFNTRKLLNGSLSGAVIQTGANESETLDISIGDMSTTGLLDISIGDMSTTGLAITTLLLASRANAASAISKVNKAINKVSTERSKLGAYQNRLQHKIANLDTSAENLTAAESRIRDIDMAKEITYFTKNSILTQAATAMLAQANALPQGVLQLLG